MCMASRSDVIFLPLRFAMLPKVVLSLSTDTWRPRSDVASEHVRNERLLAE